MADTIDNLLAANRSSGVLNAIANPPQVNPLAAMNSAAEAVRSRYGVQQMGAALAAGRAYQAATDPNTGNVDTLQANKILAADPAGTLAMQTTATSGQTLQQAQQTRSIQASTAVNAGIASVMALPDARQNRDTYAGLINQLVAGGSISQPDAQAAMQDMPQGNDPSQWRLYATRHLVHNLGGADVAARVLPQIGTVNTGGATVGTVQQPQLGSSNPGAVTQAPGGVGMTLSPEGAAGTVRVIDDDPKSPTYGQPRDMPRTEWLRSQGMPANGAVPGAGGGMAPPAGGVGAGYVPGSNYVPGSGAPPGPANPPRLPGSGGAGAAPAGAPGGTPPGAAAVPAVASAAGRGTAAGLAPGEPERLQASVTAYNNDNANAGAFAQRMYPLAQAHALLSSGVTTGPSTEKENTIRSILVAQGISADTLRTAKYDELNKYLTQIVNANPMAGGSDARLASALSGNPSAHISTLANQDVIKSMIGLERMKQASLQDFKAQNLPPTRYADFQANWSAAHDPRAFVADLMTAEQRRKMVAGMNTPAERAAFGRTLDLVQSQPGLLNLSAMPH